MSGLRKTAATVAGLVGLLAVPGPARPRSADAALILVSRDDRHGHQPEVRFTVEGTAVRGLHPGAVKQIKLKITNPYGFALRIHRLSGTVTAASRRGCAVSRSNLVVRDYAGHLPVTVPARSRAPLTGSLPVTMPREASAKCADTRFTIELSGTGTKAPR